VYPAGLVQPLDKIAASHDLSLFVIRLLYLHGGKDCERWNSAKADLQKLSDQVTAYHQLEGALCEELTQYSDTSVKTLKTQFRDKVDSALSVRPSMTANQATKIKTKWNI